MKKFFKVLANISKIFSYIDIFVKVSNGLRIAYVAVKTTIDEIKASNPDFKYLGALNSVLSFIDTAKQIVDSFISIFGISTADEDVEGLSKDGGSAACEDKLSEINEDLKGFLSENR